jgi:GAF domain
MSTSLSIVSELERLANAIESDTSEASQISLPSVATRIAKNMGVRSDEVAILGLSTKWRHLYFLVPEALSKVGHIPLSSNTALAARTAREKKAEIDNDFAASRHASVFERVKIGDESAEAIQKILSVPIQADGQVVGIIQISRKGPNARNSVPDFTAADLVHVQALCIPLGKILARALQT